MSLCGRGRSGCPPVMVWRNQPTVLAHVSAHLGRSCDAWRGRTILAGLAEDASHGAFFSFGVWAVRSELLHVPPLRPWIRWIQRRLGIYWPDQREWARAANHAWRNSPLQRMASAAPAATEPVTSDYVRVKRKNRTIFLWVDPSDAAADLKAKIHKITKVPAADMKLFIDKTGDVVLDENKSLADQKAPRAPRPARPLL